MLQKLLLTLDGSELSEAAIPLAQEIASGTETEIDILTVEKRPRARARIEKIDVVPEPGVYGGFLKPQPETIESQDQAERRVRSSLERYIEDRASPLLEAGLAVTPSVRFDDEPVRAIVNHARETGADLIVMATHGRSGLAETIFGSVAHGVLDSGAAPVALVKSEARHQKS